MVRSVLVAVGLGLSCSAHAFIPVNLGALDAYARPIVLKKFIQLTGLTGQEIYYDGFQSSVGKFADLPAGRSGDFSFSADIWLSNHRKFHCDAAFVHVSQAGTGPISLDQSDLDENTTCKEVPATAN